MKIAPEINPFDVKYTFVFSGVRYRKRVSYIQCKPKKIWEMHVVQYEIGEEYLKMYSNTLRL